MCREEVPGSHFASAIDSEFDWLLTRGYRRIDGQPEQGDWRVYESARNRVFIDVDWREETVEVSVAARQEGSFLDSPMWRRVPVQRLEAALRSGGGDPISTHFVDDSPSMALKSASRFLQGVGREVLDGMHPEMLEPPAASGAGVPGLDYPSNDPWIVNDDGAWLVVPRDSTETHASFLQQSGQAEPIARARAALGLSPTYSAAGVPPEVARARLLQMLKDEEVVVRRAAAEALGLWRQPHTLDDVLAVLADEPGDEKSPVAFGTAVLASVLEEPERGRAEEELRRFGSRGGIAEDQVRRLEPWLRLNVRDHRS